MLLSVLAFTTCAQSPSEVIVSLLTFCAAESIRDELANLCAASRPAIRAS